MANKEINDFTEQTTLNNTDEFLLQETGGGTCKKVTASTIGDYIESSSTRLVNYILNGDLKVAQEWSSKVGISNNEYMIDNCQYLQSGTGVFDFAQESTTGLYNTKLTCTTADASLAAGEYYAQLFYIEGYDYSNLVGKTCTLSFDIYATKTGTSCTSFVNTGFDRSYVNEFTINASNTWEQKEVEVTFDETGGTWNYTNGKGLLVLFSLGSGSTRQTGTTGSWVTGDFQCSTNQVNHADNTANEYKLRNVSLTIGSSANFERDLVIKETFQETLEKCQRYWEASYNYQVTPGTASASGSSMHRIAENAATNATVARDAVRFLVEKRTNPNMAYYDIAGTASQVTVDASTHEAPAAGSPVNEPKFKSFQADFNTTTAGQKVRFQWVASARF